MARDAAAPDRRDDGEEGRDDATAGGDNTAFGEGGGRIRPKRKPPFKKSPRIVDIQPKDDKLRSPEIGIVKKRCGHPLRCKPNAEDHRCKDDDDLTDED